MGIDTIVLSTQHAEEIKQNTLSEAVMDEIIKPVLPTEWLHKIPNILLIPQVVLL